jgi:hypothetical protein
VHAGEAAVSTVSASSVRTSSSTMRSARSFAAWRSTWARRRSPAPGRLSGNTLGWRIASDGDSCKVTIRSWSWHSEASAETSVLTPEPVGPTTSTLIRRCIAERSKASMSIESVPSVTRLSGEIGARTGQRMLSSGPPGESGGSNTWTWLPSGS